MTAQSGLTAAEVLEMLAEDGTAGTLERPSDTVGASPYLRTGAAATYPVTLFQEEYRTAEVDGERVQFGDGRFYVAAHGLTITPAPDDRLVVGADTWRAVQVSAVPPNDGVVLYIVQGRK